MAKNHNWLSKVLLVIQKGYVTHTIAASHIGFWALGMGLVQTEMRWRCKIYTRIKI